MKLLSFGEVLWDVYPDSQVIGGAPMNFAAHMAHHGHNPYLLSAVGDDELGRMTMEQLERYRIKTDFVRVHPHKPTGRCLVTLDAQSVPSYDLQNDVAWDEITVDITALGDMDVLYFGTLALRSERNRETVRQLIAGKTFHDIAVDINIRAPFDDTENILLALSHATILKISDEELPTVTKKAGVGEIADPIKAAKALCARFDNITVVVITRGEKGSFVYDAKEHTLCGVGAVKTAVVSTVGAGDSFFAAFLSAYDKCLGLSDCLTYASQAAAWVVSHKEAVPADMSGMPKL